MRKERSVGALLDLNGEASWLNVCGTEKRQQAAAVQGGGNEAGASDSVVEFRGAKSARRE